ncbi:MAG: ParA family protein [Lachnospiraceae bacterium]|nr:ParA family protein [Lachnospiraceae bacterium]
MKIISIVELKGGTGKTTTAVTLAELLAEGDKKRKRPGSRVLLFDNDKQGNASKLFEVYERENEAPACKILKTGRIAGNIRSTKEPNLDIIPCNYYMELAELEVKADQEHAQHDRYKTALEEVSEHYDFCVIDNPPDLGMNVINTLVATDEIIIPVNLDSYSLDGLEEMVEQINQIRALNPKAKIAGVLITDYEKTDTSEAAEIWLREKSGCLVFEQKIRHSKKAKDATIYKMTPCHYSNRSSVAQDYKRFVDEYVGYYGHDLKERGKSNGI